jgi:histone H3/H4
VSPSKIVHISSLNSGVLLICFLAERNCFLPVLQEETEMADSGAVESEAPNQKIVDPTLSDDVNTKGPDEGVAVEANETPKGAEEEESGEEVTKTEPENKNAQNDIPSSSDAPKSKGRGISGFMLFVKEKREEIKNKLGGNGAPTVVTKEAGEIWRALSDDEKAEWNKRGKAYQVAGKPSATTNNQKEPTSAAIPISKVREIAKLDPEVHHISGDALKLLHEATELFTRELARRALDSGDKKRLRLIDVHHIIHANDAKFGFLTSDFVTPATLASRDGSNAVHAHHSAKTKSASNLQTGDRPNPITSYFAA